MKTFAAIFALSLLTACAHKPGAGSYADAATTYAVIESPALVEANPIFSGMSAPVAAASTVAIKQAIKYAYDDCRVDTTVETAGMSAAAWNIGLLLAAPTPISIALAIMGGTAYYQYQECQW